jgi:hypothetical protein
VNVFSPAGGGSSVTTRVPLVPASRDFVDNSYPSAQSSLCGTPEYFSRPTAAMITFGPAPDAPYTIEVIGIQRPQPLSSANSSTILTQYVPDLWFAATAVSAFGYMRDFGGQADNPQGAQSWENQYQMLMKTAAVEQFRARYQSQGWTTEQPNPIATPSRV